MRVNNSLIAPGSRLKTVEESPRLCPRLLSDGVVDEATFYCSLNVASVPALFFPCHSSKVAALFSFHVAAVCMKREALKHFNAALTPLVDVAVLF